MTTEVKKQDSEEPRLQYSTAKTSIVGSKTNYHWFYKVMHDEVQVNAQSEVSQADSTFDKCHKATQDIPANRKSKISPNRKTNGHYASNKGSKTIFNANEQLATTAERRCSSAPGLVKNERGIAHASLETGNLTAPSTPPPTTTRHHSNQLSKDNKRLTKNTKGLGDSKELELELRGDSLGFYNASSGIDVKQQQHHSQQQHYQQQHYQQTHSQQQHQQQLHHNHAKLPNLRSSLRVPDTSHLKKEKPKFEIRAVGFSLSPREKHEAGHQISFKSMENGLKLEPGKKDPTLLDNVDIVATEKSDITVRIPIIENENNSSDLIQSKKANETIPTTTDEKKTTIEILENDKKLELENKEAEAKKEKKYSHTKGRRNSKKHKKK